jgi:hypothetical protein
MCGEEEAINRGLACFFLPWNNYRARALLPSNATRSRTRAGSEKGRLLAHEALFRFQRWLKQRTSLISLRLACHVGFNFDLDERSECPQREMRRV